MKLPINVAFVATAGVAIFSLGICGTSAQAKQSSVEEAAVNGPAADYPIVIGDPYVLDGVTYTPVDTMNYDQVGYVTKDVPNSHGITGAHHTLPFPSYIEVTALDTGRTILVRLERRGPMTSDRLLALSEAALQQLGVGEGAPVRMRRVNPPEDDRAELRAGREAPLRMSTPDGLLEVLRKRLPEKGSAPLGDPRQAEISGKVPEPGVLEAIDPQNAAEVGEVREIGAEPFVPSDMRQSIMADRIEGASAPVRENLQEEKLGQYAVQLGTFSVRANAEKLARDVGGNIVRSGRFAIVRVGPFASRGQAEQTLAKLRKRGYSDALILSLD